MQVPWRYGFERVCVNGSNSYIHCTTFSTTLSCRNLYQNRYKPVPCQQPTFGLLPKTNAISTVFTLQNDRKGAERSLSLLELLAKVN